MRENTNSYRWNGINSSFIVKNCVQKSNQFKVYSVGLHIFHGMHCIIVLLFEIFWILSIQPLIVVDSIGLRFTGGHNGKKTIIKINEYNQNIEFKLNNKECVYNCNGMQFCCLWISYTTIVVTHRPNELTIEYSTNRMAIK